MAIFPAALANIPRPTAQTKRNAPGFEGHALQNQVAEEIEAIQAAIGVSGSAVPGTIEKRLTDIPASISAAVTAHAESTMHTLAHVKPGQQIAMIGDSQARGYRIAWSVPCTAPLSVPTSGVYVHCLGAEDEATLAGTGTLEVTADGMARWTAPGDSPGQWTLATIGDHVLPSSSPKKGLHVLFWRRPTVNATINVALANYRTAYDTGHMSGGGALATWIESALGVSSFRVINLGAGGAKADDILGMEDWYAAEAPGPGFDVVVGGTNSVANNVSGAAIAADMLSLLNKRLMLQRKLVVVGIAPRFKTGTTPLDSGQQEALRYVNKALRTWCEVHISDARYVDPIPLLQDPAFADLRPAQSMLKDEVHFAAEGVQRVGPPVVAALQDLGAALYASVPDMPDWMDCGVGRMLGNSGTAGVGTTTVGGLPTGWTSHNTPNCTSTIEVVGCSTHQRRALDMAYASSGGSGQYARAYSSQIALSVLGLSVGNQICFYAQIESISVGPADTVVVQCSFVGATGKLIQLSAGAATGVHRIRSSPIKIPVATTHLQFFVYALCGSSATTGRVKVSDICVTAIQE